MRLYSTKNTTKFVSLKEAVFKGLPEDNGLYMPEHIPQLPEYFFKQLQDYSFPELAFEVSKVLLQGALPEDKLKSIIESSINFPAPLKTLAADLHILELFHGPSLAFKDFGARFMSQLMSHFNEDNKQELIILVATSGDTGGAVAAGFYDTPGIEVVILYPSGKVSMLQEKQLTTLGKNIRAIEVNGTFDDCQALVKQSFLDQALCKQLRLSSANSINIARLIPQSFYYFEAVKQLTDPSKPVVFSIPSGNFGNLTAGLIAKKMGLPVHQFIAATNANNVVPTYLNTGTYTPRPSVRTISNAMDVGNPSNFARMDEFYCSTWNNMTKDITGFSYTDEETRAAVQEIYEQYDYLIDPHGAVGYLALQAYTIKNPNIQGIVLETAHPAKFKKDMEGILNKTIPIPERLAILADKQKEAHYLDPDYDQFKRWLLNNY
ncbi:MAG: threonine synthase [Saprospiraceae bacterium]